MVIFGAGKLPDVARSLGQGVKEFKKEAADQPSGPITSASTTTTADRDRDQDRRDESRVIETRREMRAEEI
jgi:TatA/E family protein of Tat protein translocase